MFVIRIKEIKSGVILKIIFNKYAVPKTLLI